jgi:hypothetical protein
MVAALAFFTLYDFPETASFLTEEERAFVVHRLKYQGQLRLEGEKHIHVAQAEEFQWKYVWGAFTDWQVYANVVIYWGVSRFPSHGKHSLRHIRSSVHCMESASFSLLSLRILDILLAWHSYSLYLSIVLLPYLPFSWLGFRIELANAAHSSSGFSS